MIQHKYSNSVRPDNLSLMEVWALINLVIQAKRSFPILHPGGVPMLQ
jgi:hypothetical protein